MDASKILRIVAGALCLIPACISIGDIFSSFIYDYFSFWVVGSLFDFIVGIFLGVTIIVGQDKLAGIGAIVLAALQALTCVSIVSSIISLMDVVDGPVIGLGLLLITNLLLLLAFVAIAVMLLTLASTSSSTRIGLGVVAAALCLIGFLIALVAGITSYVSAGLLAFSALVYTVAFALLGFALSRTGSTPAAAFTPQPSAQQTAVAPRFCTNCGAMLPSGAAFCTNCGARTADM